MIKIVEGDLLDATEDIIGHQVNAQGKMNSGVAKAIREKYPCVFDWYIQFYRDYPNKYELLGQVQYAECDDKLIANMFAQYNYGYDGGQYTNPIALGECLLNIKTVAKRLNKTVALPYKIGCVRGGADWDTVYKMIDDIFVDYEVTLYKLDRG